jgi:hypothetical protein
MPGMNDQECNPVFLHCSEGLLASQPPEWLLALFFESSNGPNSKWTLAVVFRWLSAHKPHFHGGSNTVYGGPLGVRLVLSMFSTISLNLQWLNDGRIVPRDIMKATRGLNGSWPATQHERSLSSGIGMLLRDLQLSCERLADSYEEWSHAWESMILSRQDSIANQLRLDEPDLMEVGPTTTSGVPNGYQLQNFMLHLIEA